MQDFTKLQVLCEKHKIITDIINELIKTGNGTDKFIMTTSVGSHKTKLELTNEDIEVINTLINGLKDTESQLSNVIGAYLQPHQNNGY